MHTVLAQPRGFCAGVSRAIDIVERVLQMHGAPVYVYHEIVHNGHVVGDLAGRGAVFVDDIAEIPRGAVAVFSAHGVSTAVVAAARERDLHVYDATCPLVAKVHVQARKYSKQGHAIVIVGHRGHEEVEGTMGSVPGEVHVVSTLDDIARLPIAAGEPVAYVTQTTLSLDDARHLIDGLKARFPDIVGPELDDICYATQNRQVAVRALAREVDVVLVIGAVNSSNSNRLREVSVQEGVPSYLISDASEIDVAWLAGAARVGITAGASTPEVLVTAVRDRLRALGSTSVHQLSGPRETVKFRLPAGMNAPQAAAAVAVPA
jgi:4-hydroxy-3-methylbut-2-enyl diphosphate reductase